MASTWDFRRGGKVAAISLCVFGCVGRVDSTEPALPAPAVPPPGSDVTGAPPRLYACTDAQKLTRGLSSPQMRRLSRDELLNTLRDLLGEAIAADPAINTKLDGLPVDQTVTAGDFSQSPPVALANVLFGVSARAVTLALADLTWKSAHLPQCTLEALTDACVIETLQTFGAQVWRRDLSDGEVQSYLSTYHDSGGDSAGLSFMLRRLLMSPSLVFHVEEGTPGATGKRVRLTDFEVASRISYRTSDTMPDAELFAAARAGKLQSLAVVREHVGRLLRQASAHRKAKDFFRYYAHLASVPDPGMGPAKLVGIPAVVGLGAEMKQEALDFFENIYGSSAGTFNDLMTSSLAYPRTPAMARIFGVASPASATLAADSPSHPGLLHRPALLTSPGARTSPIIRGAHLRKLFLCDAMPLPDPVLVKERQTTLGDIEQMSTRDKTTLLTGDGTCLGCHSRINGLGFVFEGFDQLGAQRSVESIFDVDGSVTKTWPIDTAVTDLNLEVGGPTHAVDSLQLAKDVGTSPKARACFARRLFEYYQLSAPDPDVDGCALSEAESVTQDGTLAAAVAAVIGNEDIFWKAQP